MTNAEVHGCPYPGWVCFHCGEEFRTVGGAADHFGTTPDRTPACQIKLGDERGLVMALREAEREAEAWRIAGEAMEAARDAVATQVARLRGLGQLVREAATDMAHIGTEELFDRAEKWDAALAESPTTSLARLIAEKQADTADMIVAALRGHGLTEAEGLATELAAGLRRQAEEARS